LPPVRLTVACGPYAHTRALANGSVAVQGVDLTWLELGPEEIFWRMLRHEEFDASELSFSSYTILRSRGDRRFVALPLFPSRLFRHSAIFVREGSPLHRPEDLRGCRVGVPEYEMTAAVWVRGFLQDEHGVSPADVEWRTGGLEQPGREEKVRITPPGVRLQPVPPDQTLAGMLLRGELDALVTARAPTAFMQRRGLVRLLPDYAQRERDYYQRTGVFPIMHTFVVRQEVLAERPWLATSLFQGFCASRDVWLATVRNGNSSLEGIPFITSAVEEAERLMGPDFWPYGLEPNRPSVETLLRYMSSQGLLERPLTAEELFAPSTLQGFRI
jgi:4,5-dihydroxyphthalate decarboxylase